jgi:hypothetical protein
MIVLGFEYGQPHVLRCVFAKVNLLHAPASQMREDDAVYLLDWQIVGDML